MRLLVDLQCLQSTASAERAAARLELLAGLRARREAHDVVTVLLRQADDSLDVLRTREALRGIVGPDDVVVVPAVAPAGDGHDGERRRAAREVVLLARDPDAVLVVDPAPDGGGPEGGPAGRSHDARPTFVISDAAVPRRLLESCALVLVDVPTEEAVAKVWAAARAAAESTTAESATAGHGAATVDRRRSLALVSPWPPTRSGIADFAVSTLGHLGEHYDVSVVTDSPWADLEAPHLSREAFGHEWWRFDRVLYHLGNSTHHAADLELLGDAPGVAVVHDAVLTGAIHSVTAGFGHPGGLDSLLAADGREPADEDLDLRGTRAALAPALGILVHSEHAKHLLRTAGVLDQPIRVSPLPVTRTREESRRRPAGARTGVPVLAHFGFVNAFKGALDLVDAAAVLVRRGQPCRVAFVGEFLDRRLRRRVVALADRLGVELEITGFVSPDAWTGWLESAACAVQLRQQSHGESSAALGELLAAGLPVVCTDTGSFAELPEGIVRHVPQGATGDQLADVIAAVLEPVEAARLGRASQAYAEDALSPARWAAAVAGMLEESYAGNPGLAWAAATAELPPGPAPELAGPGLRRSRCSVWLSDTSVYAHTPFFSGIQRVTLALHRELMHLLPDDQVLLFPSRHVEEPPDDPHPAIAADALLSRVQLPMGEADWLLCLDLDVRLARARDELLAARARGLRVAVNLYDLLPVLHPEWFPRESGPDGFAPWLRVMLETADLVLVNSRSTAEDLRAWVVSHPPERVDSFEVALVRLGSDSSVDAAPRPTGNREGDLFVMVGTIEPRKGHAAVLDAFEQMWAAGSSARLTVVGRGGWMVHDLLRRMTRLERADKRFRWAQDVDDSGLRRLYQRCTAVIMASRGEGFGLPIIEAAAHGAPVVARDLPVFREVAGDAAVYFQHDGTDLVEALTQVQATARAGTAPAPSTKHLRPWRDVATELTALLTGQRAVLDAWSPATQRWTGGAPR
jgi:glycosyltransferase involved in cell wall biosynthesis